MLFISLFLEKNEDKSIWNLIEADEKKICCENACD